MFLLPEITLKVDRIQDQPATKRRIMRTGMPSGNLEEILYGQLCEYGRSFATMVRPVLSRFGDSSVRPVPCN